MQLIAANEQLIALYLDAFVYNICRKLGETTKFSRSVSLSCCFISSSNNSSGRHESVVWMQFACIFCVCIAVAIEPLAYAASFHWK